MNWNAELDKIITDNRGLVSAEAIGAMIGRTRSAVIGRCNRLGLPRLRNTGGHPRRPRIHAEPRQRKKPIVREFQSPPVPVVPLNIRFVDLEATHCREIVGTDGPSASLSCGHPVIHESSYCRWHYSINYTAPAPRRAFAA